MSSRLRVTLGVAENSTVIETEKDICPTHHKQSILL
jgi:hypothetical protein